MRTEPNPRCQLRGWGTRHEELAMMAVRGELTNEQVSERTGRTLGAVGAKVDEFRKRMREAEAKAKRVKRSRTLAEVFRK